MENFTEIGLGAGQVHLVITNGRKLKNEIHRPRRFVIEMEQICES